MRKGNRHARHRPAIRLASFATPRPTRSFAAPPPLLVEFRTRWECRGPLPPRSRPSNEYCIFNQLGRHLTGNRAGHNVRI